MLGMSVAPGQWSLQVSVGQCGAVGRARCVGGVGIADSCSGSATYQLYDSGTGFKLSNFQVPKMVSEDNNISINLLERLNVIIHVNLLTYYLAHFKYSTN